MDLSTERSLGEKGTDANGEYVIGGLLPGNYRLEANTRSLNLAFVPEFFDNTTNRNQATPVPVTANQITLNINFSLDSAGTISGKVTEANGTTPIARAVAIIAFDFNTGKRFEGVGTDESGNYKLPLPSGDYRVRAVNNTRGGFPLTYVHEWFDDTTDFFKATPVNVVVGQDTPNINFSLQRAGTIST